jgi:pimeloyl-ACP methyl ester carboxylesterase
MLRSFGGGDLFGELWGPEPPQVLALHGWRRTHDDFAAVVGPSSPGGPAAALALDLPGFGASPPPKDVWGSPEYANLVARVLEDGGAGTPGEPIVVLGHSFGGRVAVHLAAERPELVRSLVLTGVPLGQPDAGKSQSRPPMAYRIIRSMRRARLVPESSLERARKRYGSADYVAAQGVMRPILVKILAETYGDQLAAIRCPVELVWGDNDTAAPLAVAEAVESTVAGAVLTVCPGAGHLTPLTVPDRLRRAVDRALEVPKKAGAG